jgi:hypothetical protein
MTLTDLSMRIKDLVREKRHADALALFKAEKERFGKEGIAANEYLMADLITCLRQTGQPHHTFALLENYGISIGPETPQRILNAYGWALWSLLGQDASEEGPEQPEDPDEGEEPSGTGEGGWQEAAAEGRAELNARVSAWLEWMRPHMQGFNYTSVSNVLKAFLKTEGKRPNPDWGLVERVTGLFDPASLSTECYSFDKTVKGRVKRVELASDREAWYAARTKALERLERHADCESLSMEALEAFERFHYGNDVWFARRVALSRMRMGDRETARKGLEELLRKKDEWFIRKEIASILHEDGRDEEALAHCRRGLAGHGDMEYKVGLLSLTARILSRLGRKELSDRHLRLMQLLREEEGWRVPDSALTELQTIDPAVAVMTDASALQRELRPFWADGNPADRERAVGKVDRILNDNERGVDGFIRTAAGERIYFRESREAPIAAALKPGLSVSFETKPQPDGRKLAVRIRNA